MSCCAGCTVGGRATAATNWTIAPINPDAFSRKTRSVRDAQRSILVGPRTTHSNSSIPRPTSIWAMVPSASGRNSPTDAAPHANASAARTTVPSLINQARLNQSIRPDHPRDPPCRTHVAPRIDSGHVRVVGSPASKIKTLDQTRAQLTIENTVARVPASAEAQWRGSLATASHNRPATVASIMPALTIE